MRVFQAAVASLCLLTTSSFGVIHVSLVPDSTTLFVGQETRVRVLAQGTEGGLASLGGSAIASGDEALTAVTSSFAFVPAFQGWDFRDSEGDLLFPPTTGAAGLNGGWAGFGSMQTTVPVDYSYGFAELVEVASYTVRGTAEGVVTLSFQPGTFARYKPAECTKTEVMGTTSPAVITVLLPEPATIMLLGLAGLAVCRRRR